MFVKFFLLLLSTANATAGGDKWSGGRLYVTAPSGSGAGPYALFMWVTGTSCWFDTPSDQQTLQEMAKRGYVAAQVQYDNYAYPQTCPAFMAKAQPMFDPAAKLSATSVLCARLDVDCSKGIALFGFSQGSQICSLGKYYDGRVTAALLMGHGTAATDSQDFSACMASGSKYRALENNKVREMNGEHDEYFGCTLDKGTGAATHGGEAPTGDGAGGAGGRSGNSTRGRGCTRPTVRAQLSATAGVACATGNDCIQKDGSGWRAVLDAEAKSGGTAKAGHLFAFRDANPCYTFNSQFLNTAADFQFATDLDWLATAAKQR
eukprot:g3705.t1